MSIPWPPMYSSVKNNETDKQDCPKNKSNKTFKSEKKLKKYIVYSMIPFCRKNPTSVLYKNFICIWQRVEVSGKLLNWTSFAMIISVVKKQPMVFYIFVLFGIKFNDFKTN